MYLVYDVITKENKEIEITINFPSERYEGENALNYSLSLEKTVKENIFQKGLNDVEVFELMDVLNKVEENQLTQIDTIEMLERSSTNKLQKLAHIFRKNLKEGVSVVETLKESNIPRYIVMSLESAQKGGKM